MFMSKALFIAFFAYLHFANAWNDQDEESAAPPSFGHNPYNQQGPGRQSGGQSSPGWGGSQVGGNGHGQGQQHPHPHNRQRQQEHQQKMVEEFHRIMEAAVQSWNELGDTINKLADNVDNRLGQGQGQDSDQDNGQVGGFGGQGGQRGQGGQGGHRGGHGRRLWRIVPQSSLLLENVNMQLESVTNQINKGLTRINRKCHHGRGGQGGQSQGSSSGGVVSGSGSGSAGASQSAEPVFGESPEEESGGQSGQQGQQPSPQQPGGQGGQGQGGQGGQGGPHNRDQLWRFF